MASNSHVDSRVQERRLRPIYDWLDLGNNKKALQEAEKVLKKQPNFLCAKVLKALALQRLGREAECEEILDGVCAQVPTDEATLQGITICYRAIHKPHKICDVYLAASRKDPTNEELLTHLFMSYVRVGDYRKQHQHAMSLYKLRPKNPYYFWAVMSIVMQAKHDPNLGPGVALKLAEKMVAKFVAEGKIEAEQEVHLYLMILEMQGKYEEALDVIEGELGEKLKSLVTTSEKRVELLIKLERWKEANVLLKCQIEKNPDSWTDFKNYLDSMMKLYSDYHKGEHDVADAIPMVEIFDNHVPIRVAMPSNGDDYIMWYEADYLPEMVNDFFCHLIKDSEEKQGKKLRGPYLAQLELYKILDKECLDPESLLGDVMDLLVNYFDKFGGKAICVWDLEPYLTLLNVDAVPVFMKRISDLVGLQDGESPTTLPSLQKHISLLLITRKLGLHSTLTIEERLKFCNSLLINYLSTKKLVSPDKLPTDFACNDPYIILLSHVLFSLYLDTNCKDHIIRAIYHLENALLSSPSNFHFKLLLIKFYLLLGAGQQAFHFYDILETKYIQLDSMGYLIATSGYGLGCFASTVTVYDATLKFFFGNTNDSVDHLTYAYKYGSFIKIQEFLEFRDRLNASVHYTFCTVEKMLHDLLWSTDYSHSEMVIKTMEVKPTNNEVNWSNLRDNRDLDVIVSYEPPGGQINKKTTEKTFDNLRNYVKLRRAILNCLCAVFEYVNDGQNEQNKNEECEENGETECVKDILLTVVSEMTGFHDELKAMDFDVGIQEIINTPPPCRLKNFVKLPVCQILSDLVGILLLLETPREEENKLMQYSESVIQNLQNVTKSCVSRLNFDSIQTRETLEELVGIGEIFAISAILCGNLKCCIKRSRKSMRKIRRKKDDEGGNEIIVFRSLLKNLSECLQEVDGALSKLTDLNSMKEVTIEVEALNMKESSGDYSNIEKKLLESYSSSVQEIRQFIQEKIFYVNSLLS